MNLGSSVSTVRYRQPRNPDSFSSRGKNLSSIKNISRETDACPASQLIGVREMGLLGLKQSGSKLNHPRPSTTEVKSDRSLLHIPHVSSSRAQGQIDGGAAYVRYIYIYIYIILPFISLFIR